MITLDTNLGISSSFHYLLVKLRRKYGLSGKTVDKNAETQGAKGASEVKGTENTKEASEVQLKENLDYEQLIKDLKLNLPQNRFAILLEMPPSELYEMLKLLGKDNLLNGLKFFTKEKLMGFISHLPKRDLLKMLFYMFTDRDQLIENLPLKELHRFLGSNKIEKGHLMKMFELLPQQTLAVIAGYLTEQNCDKMKRPDLLDKIGNFKKYQMVNGLKQLDEKTLRGFITTLTESFPKLYNEFSHVALFKVSEKFARTDLIDSMRMIDDSKIMLMLSELPEKLLALTVSQIDPEVFSHLLLKDHKELLANLLLGK